MISWILFFLFFNARMVSPQQLCSFKATSFDRYFSLWGLPESMVIGVIQRCPDVSKWWTLTNVDINCDEIVSGPKILCPLASKRHSQLNGFFILLTLRHSKDDLVICQVLNKKAWTRAVGGETPLILAAITEVEDEAILGMDPTHLSGRFEGLWGELHYVLHRYKNVYTYIYIYIYVYTYMIS